MQRRILTVVLPLFLALLSLTSAAQELKEEIEVEIGEEVPYPARGIIELGFEYYEDKQYDQAIAEYERVILLFPGTDYAAEAEFRIANVYHWGTREQERSIAAYEKVMDDYPDSEFARECLVRIGSIYHWELDKSYPETAIEYYQRMLSEAPDHKYAAEALFWMGEAYNWMIKDKDKALEVYQDLIDKYPESDRAIKAQLRIADAYRRMQWDDPRAKEIYEKIASEQSEGPNLEEARYYLGLFYMLQHDLDSALQEFKSAVNYSTDHIECLYWAGYRIANIYGCYGCPPDREEERQDEITRFLEIHRQKFPAACQRIMTDMPGSHNAILAQYLLGKLYIDDGQEQRARQVFENLKTKTKSSHKFHIKAYCQIARTYANDMQFSEAIAELQEVLELELGVRRPGILFQLASTYYLAGDWFHAREVLNEIRQLHYNSPAANWAASKLYVMDCLGL